MPELPEVELIAKTLNKLLGNQTIFDAELIRARLAPDCSAENFSKQIRDSVIHSVLRRGKYLLFSLGNARTLLVHLRMTGRFMLFTADDELPKHSHAIFYLESENRLIFQDQRHFGFMKIVATKELTECKELRNLAPEPFSIEFSPNYFFDYTQKSARSIKDFLLDQTKVCGLGNIYAAEALFMAKIDPQISANRISRRKASVLHQMIKDVLAESIDHGSTMNIDPKNIEGSYYGGAYERHWRVYDQENNPCQICSASIKRISQGGRSTFFCPECQQ